MLGRLWRARGRGVAGDGTGAEHAGQIAPDGTVGARGARVAGDALKLAAQGWLIVGHDMLVQEPAGSAAA